LCLKRSNTYKRRHRGYWTKKERGQFALSRDPKRKGEGHNGCPQGKNERKKDPILGRREWGNEANKREEVYNQKKTSKTGGWSQNEEERDGGLASGLRQKERKKLFR